MGIAPPVEFMELQRYVYDLTPREVVIDAGGYDGKWAESIVRLYNPCIHVFEPVPRFADLCRRRHAGNPKVHIHQSALSTVSGIREFHIQSNDSGFYALGAKVDVPCVDVAGVVTGETGLLKLNIESEEFNVLMRMIDTGVVRRVRDIQVQFHREYPHAEFTRHLLRAKLLETHRLTYDYPFVWENWRRK